MSTLGRLVLTCLILVSTQVVTAPAAGAIPCTDIVSDASAWAADGPIDELGDLCKAALDGHLILCKFQQGFGYIPPPGKRWAAYSGPGCTKRMEFIQASVSIRSFKYGRTVAATDDTERSPWNLKGDSVAVEAIYPCTLDGGTCSGKYSGIRKAIFKFPAGYTIFEYDEACMIAGPQIIYCEAYGEQEPIDE